MTRMDFGNDMVSGITVDKSNNVKSMRDNINNLLDVWDEVLEKQLRAIAERIILQSSFKKISEKHEDYKMTLKRF